MRQNAGLLSLGQLTSAENNLDSISSETDSAWEKAKELAKSSEYEQLVKKAENLESDEKTAKNKVRELKNKVSQLESDTNSAMSEYEDLVNKL